MMVTGAESRSISDVTNVGGGVNGCSVMAAVASAPAACALVDASLL